MIDYELISNGVDFEISATDGNGIKYICSTNVAINQSDEEFDSVDSSQDDYEIEFPNGMAYNSYVIDDKKIAIMDTVDKIVTDKWIKNLEKALNGREPEYLVVQHLEPAHSGNINTLYVWHRAQLRLWGLNLRQ